MAGDVGGFGEFLYITCFLVIGGYANQKFFAATIKDMFLIRDGSSDTKINDLE